MKGYWTAVALVFVVGVGFGWSAHEVKVILAEGKQELPPPTASSTVDIPCNGSVKDDAGNVWTISQTAHVTKTEAVTPIPPEPPVPPNPGVVTFKEVVDIHGNVKTAATAGIELFLHGTGFPATPGTYKRLNLAGKAMGAHAWTATSIEFGIPNTLTDGMTQPITGPFEVYEQVNGQWVLRGKGGSFTILPSPRPAGRRPSGRRSEK